MRTCGDGGRVGRETHFRTLVQPLLVLLRLAYALCMALELSGTGESRAAVDAGHGAMAHRVVLVELRLLDCVSASYARADSQGILNVKDGTRGDGEVRDDPGRIIAPGVGEEDGELTIAPIWRVR